MGNDPANLTDPTGMHSQEQGTTKPGDGLYGVEKWEPGWEDESKSQLLNKFYYRKSGGGGGGSAVGIMAGLPDETFSPNSVKGLEYGSRWTSRGQQWGFWAKIIILIMLLFIEVAQSIQ